VGSGWIGSRIIGFWIGLALGIKGEDGAAVLGLSADDGMVLRVTIGDDPTVNPNCFLTVRM